MRSLWSKMTSSIGSGNASDGGSLTRIGRDAYEYRRGQKRMVVEVEMLSGNPDRVVYAASLRGWEPVAEADPIDGEERQRIVTEVVSQLTRQGHHPTVEWAAGTVADKPATDSE